MPFDTLDVILGALLGATVTPFTLRIGLAVEQAVTRRQRRKATTSTGGAR